MYTSESYIIIDQKHIWLSNLRRDQYMVVKFISHVKRYYDILPIIYRVLGKLRYYVIN